MTTQERAQTPSAVPGGPSRLSRLRRARKISYWCAAVAVIAAAAIILTVAAGPATKAAPPPPPAKSFSLAELGHSGATVSLAAYAGRPVIINFFASWCGPCQRETPMLARFYAAQHGRVVVLGIDANDEAGAALRFTRKAGVAYPVGFDPFPASTTTSYGVYALPQTFFLNARHRIVSKVVGPVTMKDLIRGVALMDQDRG